MRICYVSNNLEVTDNKILKELIKHDYDVHVVSIKKREIKSENKIEGIQYCELIEEQKFYENRLHGFNPLWFFAAYRFVKKIIAQTEPDVLHGGYASICGFICALTKFHPFLLMPWGSDVLVYPQKSIAIKKLVAYAIKNADMITCDAERIKKIIVNRFNFDSDKIVVFPRGIDINLFSPCRDSNIRDKFQWRNNKIIICTRQHKNIYGIEYLIDAIPKIVEKEPLARFLFIGEGPLTIEYKKRIKKLRIEEYVKFLGFIKNEFLPQYLNSADIYVSPSLSDGSSLCLLEAMACSLPVVVTDVEAILEWIKDGYNGLVCAKRKSDCIAEKILLFLSNEKMRGEMGQINYTIARDRADWNRNFSKLENIYNRLLSMSRSGN